MSMKTATSPRRVYARKDAAIVLFAGRMYSAKSSTTKVTVESPVICTKLPSDGGRARIEVTQVAADGETKTVEVWRTLKVNG